MKLSCMRVIDAFNPQTCELAGIQLSVRKSNKRSRSIDLFLLCEFDNVRLPNLTEFSP